MSKRNKLLANGACLGGGKAIGKGKKQGVDFTKKRASAPKQETSKLKCIFKHIFMGMNIGDLN